MQTVNANKNFILNEHARHYKLQRKTILFIGRGKVVNQYVDQARN